MGLGVPHAGPMDPLAFRSGNILVGNPLTTEGLEIVLLPGVGFEVEFFVSAVICITGKDVLVTLNDGLVDMWARIIIPCGGKLRLDVDMNNIISATGFRAYLTIRGGFPSVPTYLGSKSTSMGLGGYQVCLLTLLTLFHRSALLTVVLFIGQVTSHWGLCRLG
jgi:urea carboxylase